MKKKYQAEVFEIADLDTCIPILGETSLNSAICAGELLFCKKLSPVDIAVYAVWDGIEENWQKEAFKDGVSCERVAEFLRLPVSTVKAAVKNINRCIEELNSTALHRK